MAAKIPREVFLSHSSLDRQFASDLAIVMQRHEVPVWYSQTNILGAQQWQAEIGAALQRCDWFAVILSAQSVDSMWVRREVSYALEQTRFDNRIVPIEYQSADYDRLSWALSLFQKIDFTRTFDEGCVDLFRIWGLGYRNAI
jgi:hypothetical protein